MSDQQKPDDLLHLNIWRDYGDGWGVCLILVVRRADLPVVEPALQRILRNGLNQTFHLIVKEVVCRE